MSASKTKSIKPKPVPDQSEFETTQTLVQEQATPSLAPDDVVVVNRSRELEDYLGETGHALKIAPVAFLITALLGLALGFGVASFSSDQSAAQMGTQLRTIAGGYSNLSNSELRQSALNLVSQMRGFLVEWAIDASQANPVSEIQAAPSAIQQKLVWKEYVAASMLLSREWASKFTNEFAPHAKKVRDELRSRLNSTQAENVDHLYESASNPIEVRQVMEDLGRLAESLLSP